MKKYLFVVPVLGIVAVLMLAFTGPFAESRAAELPTIEIGLPEDGVFGLGGQFIIDHALDRKHGFAMKARWAGVADVERLLAIGAIPVGLATSESALRAHLNNIPIRLITPYMTPHNSVLVRKEAPYKNLMDLKGKPFAAAGSDLGLQ